MGRYDPNLGRAMAARGLAAGLYATTPVQTAFGWQTAGRLAPGDLVLTRDHGLMPLESLAPDPRSALWSVRLPAKALGNVAMLMLPPGQPVLIDTPHAMPFTGEASALVPATALEGWRGIAPHVPADTAPILRLTLSIESLISTGPGLWTPSDAPPRAFEVKHLLEVPQRCLPLSAARQLIAQLIAEDAGRSLTPYAARRPENRA